MLSKLELETLAGVIDELDLYRVLKVAPHASNQEIKMAFHQQALSFHPDQYQKLKDPHVFELSKKIYSRIAEAYRTLSNKEKRTAYDVSLQKRSQPQKGIKAPSPSVSEKDENEITAVRVKEKTAVSSAGLRFFKLAQAAFQARDLNSAKMNIQIALNTDAHSPEFLDLAHRIQVEAEKKNKKT
jgi:DnaJ-class molecular chaperone